MWRFRELQRADINHDPVQGEFFGPEEGYSAALVRESIQNTLDAKDKANTEPARIRIAFHDDDFVTMESTRFFTNLEGHLIAQGIENRPARHDGLKWLVIEDFNTRGLEGDPNQAEDPEEEAQEKNDFFYFWRNIGRSEKQEEERGRWGVGKTVFTGSSRIQSFFGYTIQKSTGNKYLMGQSLGKTHWLNDQKFAYYGYFADFEDDGFASPHTDGQTISDFTSLFRTTRTDEPGLSVVIPFPMEDISYNEVVEAVVRSFYYSFLQSQLIVEVVEGDRQITISRETLDEVVRTELDEIAKEELQPILGFAKRVCSLAAADAISLPLVGQHSAPAWSESLFSDFDLNTLRDRYEAGEILAIRPSIVIKKHTRVQENATFMIFIARDPNGPPGAAEFIRQGLTISDVNRGLRAGTRGMVVVDDGPLSSLLGDAENPAHTKWQEKRIRSKYIWGPSVVRFVSKSLNALSEYLTRPPAGRDEELLSDIFFLDIPPQDEAETESQEPIDDGDEKSQDPDLDIKLSMQPFGVEQTGRGFRITGNPEASDLPNAIIVKVGYRVRRGNPFKKYQPFDFRLDADPIEIVATSATYRAELNTLEVFPKSNEFAVEVVGFDPHRDLDVQARTA